MNRYIIPIYPDTLFELDFPMAIKKMIVDTKTGNMFHEDMENRHYIEYLQWVNEGNPPAEEWNPNAN